MTSPLQKIAGYFAAPAVGGPPVAQATGAPQTPGGYQLLDIRRQGQAGAAKAGADGLITATFPEVDPGCMWLVDRMAVYCMSSTPTLAAIYIGSVAPQNLADGSVSGNLDFGDSPSGILVPGSQSLVVQWQEASANSTAFAIAQYRLMGGAT